MKTRSEQWHWFCLSKICSSWSVARLNTLLLATCLFVFCISSPAMAQRSASSLSGTVTDQSGAVVPTANMVITEISTGVSTTARTNGQGFYLISNLQPGTYKLHVEKAGFEGFERTGIVIQVGQPTTIDLAMKVGAESQQVTVTGEPPLVNTSNETVSFAITPQFTEQMPLDGRQVLQLIALAPDTSAHNPAADNYSSQISTRPETVTAGFNTASGEARENSTTFYLDGGLDEDAYTDVANVFPNPDAVEEFTVDTNSYNAKFGGRGGAIVNAVTKGGSNKIHGSAFEYLRNNYVNANNYFATTPDTLKRNQFGFSLGGPLIKDKTFWFGSFQRTTFRYGTNSNIGAGPTADELAGDWSTEVPVSTYQLTNPFTGLPFSANQVSTTLYNPTSLALLKLIPTGNALTGTFNFPTVVSQDDNQYVAKVDQHLGDKTTISASYLWDQFSNPDIAVQGDILSGGQSGAGNQVFTSQHAALNLTYRFGNNLLTTLGAALSRVVYIESGLPQFKNGLSSLSPPANYPNWAPNLDEVGFYIGGEWNIGAYWNGSLDVTRNQTDITNNWTYVKGHHTLDFGGELPYYESINGQAYVSAGYAGWFQGPNFNGSNSGSEPLDFMLGSNEFYEQYVPSYVSPRGQSPAIYANDVWRIKTRLNLNLGARWEPWLPWPDSSEGKIGSQLNVADFAAGVHSTRFPNLPAGFLVRGDRGVPNGLAPSDWQLLDPRVGLAWDVFGNGGTSVRAGFGIYHDQPFGRMYNEMTDTLPFNSGAQIDDFDNGTNINAYNPYAAAPYNGTAPLPNLPTATTAFPLPLSFAIGFSPVFKPPVTFQWNLTAERQLGYGVLLRTGYEASESYHMFDSRDINPSTDGTSATRPMYEGGVGYSGKAIINESNNTSSYNALVISLEKRMTGNLSFLGGFRWAKCIDVGGSDSSFAINEFTDPRRPYLDRGICDSDLKYQFKVAAVWQTPSFRSLGFAGREFLGGWSISGILSRHTGFPFSVLAFGDPNLDGDSFSRANVTGNPNLSGGSTSQKIAEWFNTAAFSEPVDSDGDSPRNFLRGPRFVDLDTALIKSFAIPFGPFRDTQKIDFRFEAFNLFNHPNLGQPGDTLSGGALFGQITSAQSPRDLQAALKYIF
jgi:hypothetical protein